MILQAAKRIANIRSYINQEEIMAAKFNKKPVTGMKDILPAEMQIRDYVMNLIKETYRGFGFTQIETPCFESVSYTNLTLPTIYSG